MKRSILFLALAAMLLSSCFIPDNYAAEVWVHKDGSYEFLFQGELAYAPAIEKILEGEFSDKDLDDMYEIEEDLFDTEGVMEVEYIKDGRFRIDVVMPLAPGEDYDFISEDIAIFSFKHNDKGQLEINGLDLSDEDRDMLKDMNIKMEGDLKVVTDKGVKVKSHNANKKIKDKKAGTVTYLWNLNADAEKPNMVIKH
jgi:hypothetical protein